MTHDKRMRILKLFSRKLGILNKIEDMERYIWFESMSDNGIGGFYIRGITEDNILYGGVRGRYIDEDGVPVLIILLVDKFDNPSEMDFSKLDYSGISHFPTENEIFDIEIDN